MGTRGAHPWVEQIANSRTSNPKLLARELAVVWLYQICMHAIF
uniref:Uncharacterized protein n=1 Tax=Arundo donax TaxID=35708 RepID=A0A0A9CK52_ARUDO